MNLPELDYEEHIYRLSGNKVPGITQIMQENELIPHLMTNHAACRRGVVVHRCCELMVKGTLKRETVHEVALPYVSAFELFLSQVKPKIKATEKRVYDPVINCAGTLDLELEMLGGEGVADIKTGKAMRQHGVQLAFYDVAGRGGNFANVHNIQKRKRWIIELHSDGKYRIHDEAMFDDSDYSAIPALVAAANWKRNAGLFKWKEKGGYYFGDI